MGREGHPHLFMRGYYPAAGQKTTLSK